MGHVMIDLETMGTGNRAAIISIGAAKFTLDDGITDTFHVGVELASNAMLNMQMDAGTVLWWMDPERDEARKAWLALPKVNLIDALDGFARWFNDDTGDRDVHGVWGNGANFDNVIIRNALNQAGIECPWPFWLDRCFRTMKAQWTGYLPQRKGTHHAALDDAIWQAEALRTIWQGGL